MDLALCPAELSAVAVATDGFAGTSCGSIALRAEPLKPTKAIRAKAEVKERVLAKALGIVG